MNLSGSPYSEAEVVENPFNSFLFGEINEMRG